MTHRTVLLATLAALALATAGALADPLAEADRLRSKRDYAGAANKALAVGRDAKQEPAHRLRAFELAARCYVDLYSPRAALAVYAEAVQALGEDGPQAAALWAQAADVYGQRLPAAEAALFLERIAARHDLGKYPPKDAVRVLLALAKTRARLGQHRAALEAAEQATRLAPKPGMATAVLIESAELHADVHRFDRAIALLAAVTDKQLGDHTTLHGAAKVYGEVLGKLVAAGKRDEARALCDTMIRRFATRSPATAAAALQHLIAAEGEAKAIGAIGAFDDGLIVTVAQEATLASLVAIAIRSDQIDAMVRICVRAMLARPLDQKVAGDCVEAIARLRIQQGRQADALAAAWAHYAIAGFEASSSSSSSSSTAYNAAVGLIAHALRARDGHLLSANAFRSYQLYGPNGPDRKPRTPDDVPHPLKGVAFRADPALDPLYEAALKAQPLTLAGRRARAWIYFLWCKHDKALGELKRAFALCSLETRALSQAAQEVALGLMALNATPVGMDAFATFQRYGANGPDGRAKTADDLKDPLAGL